MKQESLFTEICSTGVECAAPHTSGDATDIFDRYDLPRERVVDGVRYCRHHTTERIALPVYPCRECWREASESEVRDA